MPNANQLAALRAIPSGTVPTLLGTVGTGAAIHAGVGSPSHPRPGFWPLILSLALIALGIGLLASGTRGRPIGWSDVVWPATLVGCFAVFVIAVQWLGLTLAVAALMLVLTRFYGRVEWKLSIIVSAAVTVVVYLLFVELLEVPLPQGPWGF